MTYRTVLLITALTASLSFSQPASAAANEAGPNIKLKNGQTLSGRFVHEHPVDGFDKPMRTEGRYTVDTNNRIVWAIEKPMMTTTTITNEGLTQSVGQYTLLKVSAQQMPFLAEMQQKLLWAVSGDWEKLKPDFILTHTGGPQAWEVTITPKENPQKRKPFSKLVARGSRYVERADIVLPSGTVDHVTFSDSAVSP